MRNFLIAAPLALAATALIFANPVSAAPAAAPAAAPTAAKVVQHNGR